MNDAEVGFVLELTWLLKLSVCALLLEHLVDKGLVCGLRKPALLIQQREDARRIILRKQKSFDTNVCKADPQSH